MSIFTSTTAIPHSMVHRIEGVLLVEIAILSLKIIAESQTLESEWAKALYEELVMWDEVRLMTLHNV